MKKLISLILVLTLCSAAACAFAERDTTWYGHNTAGVIGISLRDQDPNLTDKWYNVLPVDVSTDGTQTFPLVASNKYYLGEVTVTVAGDEITTEYSFPVRPDYELYPEEELLAWFTSLEEITPEFLENPTSDLKFGQAISRENNLNGQETALLFVLNRVTYAVPFNKAGDKPVEFWRNYYKMADYFASAKALLEKAESEHAQKKADAEAAALAEAEAAAAAAAEAEIKAAEEELDKSLDEAAEAVGEVVEAVGDAAIGLMEGVAEALDETLAEEEAAQATEAPAEETEAPAAEATEAPAEETETANP